MRSLAAADDDRDHHDDKAQHQSQHIPGCNDVPLTVLGLHYSVTPQCYAAKSQISPLPQPKRRLIPPLLDLLR